MFEKEPSQLALVARKLKYTIGDRTIFQEFDFCLPNGKICLILGPSGCGKTTLLSILAGLQKPDQGEVLYGGVSLYALDENRRDQFRGQNIGILFQNFHLIKSLTVLQNVLIAGVLAGKENDVSYVGGILDRLGLRDKANQKTNTLSIGEAQRLALARAIVGKPKWLLCDEPTSSLDDKNTQSMLELIQQEAKQIGTSLIIVTHDNRVKRCLSADQTIELGE